MIAHRNSKPLPPRIPFTRATVKAAVRDLGLTFRAEDGEYRVAPSIHHLYLSHLSFAERNAVAERLAYYTNDLQDALGTAQLMASEYSMGRYRKAQIAE